MQISNQSITATQRIKACRCSQEELLKFKQHQNGEHRWKVKLPRWCQRSEEDVQTGSDTAWLKGNSNSNEHSLKYRYTDEHLWRTIGHTSKKMSYSRWRLNQMLILSVRLQFMQAYQNWTREAKKKMLPGLMSLKFWCDIRTVGSEFSVNNMKLWIHLTLEKQFRLLVVEM